MLFDYNAFKNSVISVPFHLFLYTKRMEHTNLLLLHIWYDSTQEKKPTFICQIHRISVKILKAYILDKILMTILYFLLKAFDQTMADIVLIRISILSRCGGFTNLIYVQYRTEMLFCHKLKMLILDLNESIS